MNLDDRIKQALRMDEAEVERTLLEESGLLPRALGVFKGSMKGWNVFGFLLSFVFAIGMFWSGYYFFISESQPDRLFWGFIGIVFVMGTMVTKIWFWMEMNRYSTSREIKRLELAIAQLTAKLNQ